MGLHKLDFYDDVRIAAPKGSEEIAAFLSEYSDRKAAERKAYAAENARRFAEMQARLRAEAAEAATDSEELSDEEVREIQMAEHAAGLKAAALKKAREEAEFDARLAAAEVTLDRDYDDGE